MRACWRDGSADDSYLHPFSLPHGYLDADLAGVWLDQRTGKSFAETMTPQVHLCRSGKAPKQAATPEYAAVVNYAYHLDAVKLGHLLREHCTRRLGIEHVSDHVTGVESADNGDIAALILRDSGRISADLFVDCTINFGH